MAPDRTTEEGRPPQTGTAPGKKEPPGHHHRQMVPRTATHATPEYAPDWAPGSGTCLHQETLYRSVSCRRRLRRTAPCETPGMATQVRLAFHRRYWCSSIACRSTGQQSSAPSPPSQPEFHDRDAK